MKKALGWVVAWTLYGLGDLVSRQMGDSGRGYRLYSWLMVASGDVQDWAGLDKPWTKACEHIANQIIDRQMNELLEEQGFKRPKGGLK